MRGTHGKRPSLPIQGDPEMNYCYAIYTSSGTFVCRFEELISAEFFRRCNRPKKYTIRGEWWND